MKATCDNLLQRYGYLAQGQEVAATGGGTGGTGKTSKTGGAKPKGGRRPLTQEQRDMIKGGSMITRARKGLL